MRKPGFSPTFLFKAPHFFTSLRIVFGVGAVFGAASLFIIGLLTDFSQDWCASSFHVSSKFSMLFADSLDYVVTPIHSPKFAKYKFILFPVVAGLSVMPFVLTKDLAFLSVFLVFLNVKFSPLSVKQRPERTRIL